MNDWKKIKVLLNKIYSFPYLLQIKFIIIIIIIIILNLSSISDVYTVHPKSCFYGVRLFGHLYCALDMSNDTLNS